MHNQEESYASYLTNSLEVQLHFRTVTFPTTEIEEIVQHPLRMAEMISPAANRSHENQQKISRGTFAEKRHYF